MILKRLRKVKKVSERLPELVADKAAGFNPLGTAEQEPPALRDIPHITTETIGEHREEVLSGARKYIYPLQHSKHRIVVITSIIIFFTVLTFLVYCTAALYLLYQYKQQDKFGGQQQIITFRKQALDDVINNAYVKILADKNKVKVSDKEIDNQIAAVRNQNRLGSNDKVFADVLRDYWGWSINDFRRSLKEQMLATKVAAKLDTTAHARAEEALKHLHDGGDFADQAKVASDASDKQNGGDYGFGITKTNPNVPPEVIDQLFKLKPGEVSDVILATRTDVSRPNTLEIVRLNASDGTTVTAQHISFNLKDISVYIDELKAKQPVKTYVHF